MTRPSVRPTHVRRSRTRRRYAVPALVAAVALASGCAGSSASTPTSAPKGGTVTVTNCGARETFPSPAQRLYVTGDGNLLSMVLALGAEKQIAGVTGLAAQKQTLSTVYGKDVVDRLPVSSQDYPTMENAIATRPDVVVSGWNYGYTLEKKFTPEDLKGHDIAPYVLSESCKQGNGARGTMPPWDALYADLGNLGEITGRQDRARAVIADITSRLGALTKAPRPAAPPTVFLFDSGTKNIFTSGAFGGPHAIIEAAGARNATADLKDSWTEVSWERLVSAKPDFFAFVDYPGQSFADKVAVLRSNPATKNLPAVTEGRFINLPISSWTSSPTNIDAAEQLRKALEKHGLVPASGISPRVDLQPSEDR
ncbi:ABC transporter substrate-binding protein [Knoellia sp. S7-12]|uniref:ABC transporter substrate-binding protein n=1 Tax=Knoellia sp. S7-12 TaxID=3126698 RepID=UPI0033681A24